MMNARELIDAQLDENEMEALNEGLKLVNLSFAELIDLNSNFRGDVHQAGVGEAPARLAWRRRHAQRSGKMSSSLYALIVKKFGKTASSITAQPAAVRDGVVAMLSKSNDVIATVIFGGNYLKVEVGVGVSYGGQPTTKYYKIT